MQDELRQLLEEDRYPGNTEAWIALMGAARSRTLIGFVGAGASAPAIPSWGSFLSDFARSAHRDGLCGEVDRDHYLRQINEDPLQVADDIEELFGRRPFRSALSKFFSSNDTAFGKCHRLIVEGPYKGIVTLNYDLGLESAYVSQHGTSAFSLCSSNGYQSQQWSSGTAFQGKRIPIFHLHGIAHNPDSIILTAGDYHKFYAKDGKAFVAELWRNSPLLVVGFGFKDPFLTAIADAALRDLASDNQHFAFVGCGEEDAVSHAVRRQFTKKYRLRPIFYRIRRGNDQGGSAPDHSALLSLLEHLNSGVGAGCATPMTATKPSAASASGSQSYLNDVLTSPTGAPLYVEPRLRDRPKSINPKANEQATHFSIDDLIAQTDSLWILSHGETGATTLCKRLFDQLQAKSGAVFLKSAEGLPQYKAKLLKEFEREKGSELAAAVLILDDFHSVRHERLLREICALNVFSRIILCSRHDPELALERASSLVGVALDFKKIFMWPVERGDIRTLAHDLFDSGDVVFISSVVDKTYRDLVALRIPLTPVNVIMYLRILFREGDFQPLNKVQIVHRFLNEVLRSPSDDYASAFNAKNKIDLISSFSYTLHETQGATFSAAQWESFCAKYQTTKLLEFDPRKVLLDLVRNRVVVEEARGFRFRYAAYYHFFLGAHVSSNGTALRKFIATEGYIESAGTGEVICGLSAEGGLLLQDVTQKLNSELATFWKEYVAPSFNPYDSIKWNQNQNEEEELWEKIEQDGLAAPRDPKQLDEIKTCVISEHASRDQSVIFRRFDDCERRLIALSGELARMLKASDSIDGHLKVEATKALYKTQLVILQVALLLAPRIAANQYFFYKGILFVNHSLSDDADMKTRIIGLFNSGVEMIASGAAEQLASVKLGGVFKEMAKDTTMTKLDIMLNFACMLKSKPVGWEEALTRVIRATERDSWYLGSMLELLMVDLMEEVNTSASREAAMRLVAHLKAKRGLKKEEPGKKAIGRVLDRLLSHDFFRKRTRDGEQDANSDRSGGPKAA